MVKKTKKTLHLTFHFDADLLTRMCIQILNAIIVLYKSNLTKLRFLLLLVVAVPKSTELLTCL